MKRAIRRHHRERLKKKRLYHWCRNLTNEPEILARAVNTPTPCSCAMCCNIRRNKWLPNKRKLTKQEKVSILNNNEQEIDI